VQDFFHPPYLKDFGGFFPQSSNHHGPTALASVYASTLQHALACEARRGCGSLEPLEPCPECPDPLDLLVVVIVGCWMLLVLSIATRNFDDFDVCMRDFTNDGSTGKSRVGLGFD